MERSAPAAGDASLDGDLICFSHLRWEFVFQRPQHLLSRFARNMRLFYWEEPEFGTLDAPGLEARVLPCGATVVRPLLAEGTGGIEAERIQRELLDQFVRDRGIAAPVLWYYTPMALGFSAHLSRRLTVYDCMDELSLFHGAPPGLRERERSLLAQADLVFTGGDSLYEAKRGQHRDVHAFPSSVDAAHFAPARGALPEPDDQRAIPHPRIGFYGVLDERLDRDLLDRVAATRPDWHFILLGPVVKIDPGSLPRRGNIHLLGARPYAALPAYVAHWDLAMMPFARNESTRFISPTKTPEYLAAGLPVVSTPIADVARRYGALRGVGIAADPDGFVREIARLLPAKAHPGRWRDEADALLAPMSWDRTWREMADLMLDRLARLAHHARRASESDAGGAAYLPGLVAAGAALLPEK